MDHLQLKRKVADNDEKPTPAKRLRVAVPTSQRLSSSPSQSPSRPHARSQHYALRRPSGPQTPSPISPACSPTSIPLLPPITRDTLRELDLDAILRNPQLRHDLLFDPNLQFRPTSGRRKQAAADKYWAALAQDVLALQRPRRTHTRTRPPTPPPWSPRYAEHWQAPECTHAPPAQARLTLMLHELRAVLAAVIVPPPLPAHSPTPSTDLPLLLEHISPPLITQELSRGLYDPVGLFTLLGGVLKRHCAPMRDALVDQLVTVATGAADPNPTGNESDPPPTSTSRTLTALRHTFTLLELMKLDIANHQLQHLRGYLARTTGAWELEGFLAARGGDEERGVQVTRRWIQAGWSSLPASFPSAPKERRLRVHFAVIRALTSLVFPCFSSTPEDHAIPETLALDLPRLALLRRDAADLTALYMLLMLARGLSSPSPPSPSTLPKAAPTLACAEVDRLKRAIWAVGCGGRIGACFYVEPKLASSEGGCREGGHGEDDWENMAVLLASSSPSPGISPLSPASPSPAPRPETLSLLRGWLSTHMRSPSSSLVQKLGSVVRDAVERTVSDTFMRESVGEIDCVSGSCEKDSGSTGKGLEPLAPEIAHLAARVAKLAHVHAGVYWSLYAARNFLSDE